MNKINAKKPKLRRLALVIFVLIALQSTELQFAQIGNPPSKWRHSIEQDALHGVSFDQFVLDGQYLTPPRTKTKDVPSIVLRCSDGHFLQGWLDVGAVVQRDEKGLVYIERRRDGRFDVTAGDVSADGEAVILILPIAGSPVLDLIYGHGRHKEGKGELLHQQIFGVDEAFGAKVVMRFDMPDESTQAIETCTMPKKGNRH